jgi:cell division protease FtsH
MIDLEEAKDKVMMGVERRSMVMSEDEKKLTAYHEGGHALVGLYCSASSPIHKATIIPRGQSLGMVMRLPENDNISRSLEQMKADIAIGLAGRIAEELIFGSEKVTSGAYSDIRNVTRLAESMVTELGLSDKVGTIFYGKASEDMYSSASSGRIVSQKTSEIIDTEVKRIIQEGYDFAKNILTTHLDQLHLLANTLIERETMSGQEIKNLLSGREIESEDENYFPFSKKPSNSKSKDTKVTTNKAKKSSIEIKKVTIEKPEKQ